MLHLSKFRATWEHKSQSWPTDVRINGSPWNPRQTPTFAPQRAGPLLQDGLDFSEVVIHILRGYGRVWCRIEEDDLVIEFDNHDAGTELYEVAIDFAPVLARKQSASAKPCDLQLHLAARIGGTDECWLSADGLSWTHTSRQMPKNVTVNGKPWNVDKSASFSLGLTVLPETYDWQRATMQKIRAGTTMNLDYRPERSIMAFEYYDPSIGDEFATVSEKLCLDFEEPNKGADDYEARVTVPAFGQRYLVRLEARGVSDILGTPLRIFRDPAASETQAVLAGQRFFGTNGDCLVALEAGRFQFEALRHDTPEHLIALRSDWVQIAGPTNINLHPITVKPLVVLPSEAAGSAVVIDDLSLRSVRPAGAIQWTRSHGPKSEPELTLSEDQIYRVHAFGHAGTNYFAIWTALNANDKAALQADEWLERSFRWSDDTPNANSRDVLLNFPDGQMKIPRADRCRLFTNRRFFTIGYRLNFNGGRHAIFEPRGAVLDLGTHGEVLLGGTLHPVASAAIFQDEGLGDPHDLNLWHETTLVDPHGYILDIAASTITWSEKIVWKDGTALPKPPLPVDVADRIRNNRGELVEKASCILDKRLDWTNSPAGMVAAELNWYSHTWSMAHETLHNFGFGHTHEMYRLDDAVQEQMDFFRWWAADTPNYAPAQPIGW